MKVLTIQPSFVATVAQTIPIVMSVFAQLCTSSKILRALDARAKFHNSRKLITVDALFWAPIFFFSSGFKLISYSRSTCLVKPNQQLVPNLGSKVVTLGVSVDKGA